jgi:hypothetical protein
VLAKQWIDCAKELFRNTPATFNLPPHRSHRHSAGSTRRCAQKRWCTFAGKVPGGRPEASQHPTHP